MPDREMTPERALIILDRLNTDEKIEVDRGELKEAVAVAKAALRMRIKQKPIRFESDHIGKGFKCSCCDTLMSSVNYNYKFLNRYCHWCGKALDWE